MQNYESGAAAVEPDFCSDLDAEASSSGEPEKQSKRSASGRARKKTADEHLTLAWLGKLAIVGVGGPAVVGKTEFSEKGQRFGERPACARCEQLEGAQKAKDAVLQATQEREAELQAQLANLQQDLFGRKSEAMPAGEAEPTDPAGDAAGTAAETPAAADPCAGEEPQTRPLYKFTLRENGLFSRIRLTPKRLEIDIFRRRLLPR